MPLTPFVGRRRELAQVRGLLEECRLLTVTGPGGGGKTRMARTVATTLAEEDGRDVRFVDLVGAESPLAVLTAVGNAVEVGESADVALDQAVLAQVRDQDLLLVVDNCEHVSQAVSSLIRSVLEQAQGVAILATSRQPLGIPGEVVWQLRGMEVPGDTSSDERGAFDYDAVRLFVDSVGRALPGLTWTEEMVAPVVRICRRLDGLPLAIELAAARVRSIPLDRLAESLDDALSLLQDPHSRSLRHGSLRACIEWSYRLLTPPEQATFRRLSVFSAGFSIDAAEDVCDVGGLERSDVLLHVSALVEQSLVLLDGDARERYRLLETVRQFANEQARQAGEFDEALGRHFHHFATLAHRLAPALSTGAQEDARATLTADEDNLRAALTHASTLEDAHRLAALAFDLVFQWYQTGQFHEGAHWLSLALGRVDPADDAVAARLLWGLGYLNFYFGNFAASARHADEALGRALAASDHFAIGRAMTLRAHMHQLADPVGEHARLLEAREASAAAGDDWGVIDAVQTLAVGLVYRDRHDEARRQLDAVWPRVEADPNPLFTAWHWNVRLWGAARRGEDDRVEIGERALAAAVACGDRATIGWAARFLALGLSLSGEHQPAVDLLEEHLRTFRSGRAGEVAVAFLWLGLGACHLAVGDYEQARRWHEPMLELARSQQLALTMADVLHDVVRWQLAVDDAEAAPNVAQLADCARVLANDYLASTAMLYCAVIAVQGGDPAEGRAHALDSLDGFRAGGFDTSCCEALDVVAWASALGGDSRSAGRWAAAAAAERRRRGWVTPHHASAITAATLGAVTDSVALSAGTIEGSTMTLDEAVTVARLGRGGRLRPAHGWASLTPAEVRVAEQVAAGLTNPQIAERLFLSRSTVKTHLAHVFAKLGVASRAELAARVVAMSSADEPPGRASSDVSTRRRSARR